MMWPPPAPITRARSTNIRSLTDRVCDRMIRAVDAQLVMPMTMTMTMQRRPDADDLGLDADDVEDDRREDDRQDERRQDEEEVRHAHEDRVGPAADEARDDADERPDEDRDDRRQQADDHRDRASRGRSG